MSSRDGRVVIVTGAGRGLGRAHALAFASHGARVVVNDLGVSREGDEAGSSPADEVVAEIYELGGEAVADRSDVADWGQAESMVALAIDTWGRLDTLVCNAGFLRDRMLATMGEEDWDAVVRVHLKGHFVPARHAITYWRDQAKAGNAIPARVVMTSSGAGLMGSIGQGNYAAAKAGIALLVLQAAAEWERYGVLVNGVAPDARTRMTEGVIYDREIPEGWDDKAPSNVSPLVVWLGSEDCDVNGRIFEVGGGRLSVCDGWQHGPEVTAGERSFEFSEISHAVHTAIEGAPPAAPVYGSGK
ncbi:MAG: SDR family oxidoreductase [Actinomycetota bacterium]|nr:SDR family oxidoreductase [Actinomycetota bacterium]